MRWGGGWRRGVAKALRPSPAKPSVPAEPPREAERGGQGSRGRWPSALEEAAVREAEWESERWAEGGVSGAQTTPEEAVEGRRIALLWRARLKTEALDNLLPWEAKLQMRELRRADPEKWRSEVLCRAFPASQAQVKALVSPRLDPQAPEDVIRSHDRLVRLRWDALVKDEPSPHLSPKTVAAVKEGAIPWIPMLISPLMKSWETSAHPDPVLKGPAKGPFQALLRKHQAPLKLSSK